jgi:hypothetical protein
MGNEKRGDREMTKAEFYEAFQTDPVAATQAYWLDCADQGYEVFPDEVAESVVDFHMAHVAGLEPGDPEYDYEVEAVYIDAKGFAELALGAKS